MVKNLRLHAPGLAEIHDDANRCVACCCDVDPVEEDERPVPSMEEGDELAKRLVACWTACADFEDPVAEIKRLREELRLAKAERDHWKANHWHEVRRARIIKERPDLPIERVAAYEQWGKDQNLLRYLQEHAPLRVNVGCLKESSGKTTWVVYLSHNDRPEASFLDNWYQVYSDSIEGRARYEAASLAHFLGLGPSPDLLAFDVRSDEYSMPHLVDLKAAHDILDHSVRTITQMLAANRAGARPPATVEKAEQVLDTIRAAAAAAEETVARITTYLATYAATKPEEG